MLSKSADTNYYVPMEEEKMTVYPNRPVSLKLKTRLIIMQFAIPIYYLAISGQRKSNQIYLRDSLKRKYVNHSKASPQVTQMISKTPLHTERW